MNTDEFTFGIELETTIPLSSGISVGVHGRGLPVHELNNVGDRTGVVSGQWLADADPSIRAESGERRGCEFVSPVYRGVAGFATMMRDIEVIRSFGAKVNRSCGLHVHIGFDKRDAKTLDRLIATVANFEAGIFAATGTKRRENGDNPSGSMWCKKIGSYGSVETAKLRMINDRYHVMNLETGDRPTVEFRAFGGSLNPIKIAGYVGLCVATVQRAIVVKRVLPMHPADIGVRHPAYRATPGQRALSRLLFALRWQSGNAGRKVYGSEFFDSAATGVSFAAVKTTLRNLAKRYDGLAPETTGLMTGHITTVVNGQTVRHAIRTPEDLINAGATAARAMRDAVDVD